MKEEYISIETLRIWQEIEKENKQLYEIKNKAINYIQTNCIFATEWKDLGFCNFVPVGKITYKSLSAKKVKELLKILKNK